jgi:hypothetical protein
MEHVSTTPDIATSGSFDRSIIHPDDLLPAVTKRRGTMTVLTMLKGPLRHKPGVSLAP